MFDSVYHWTNNAAHSGRCAGFPSRQLPNLTDAAMRASVLLSISAFEPPRYLRELLENALSLTHPRSTLIVLHLNRLTNYPDVGVDKDFDWIWAQERVLVNCLRVAVSHSHGSILHSFAANVGWARDRGARPQMVVFQASNMFWVRRGMERYAE